MIDAVKLLGSLLQQGAAPAAQDRLQSAVQRGTGGPLDQAGGGGLAGMLGGLFGQGGAGGRGFGEMLGSVTDLAKRAAQAPVEETKANNPAALGGLGAIAGALLGGGRGAVGGGVLAVLGSLAYAALQNQGAAPAQAAPDDARLQQKAMLLVRAMIQAAKADGQIDGEEMSAHHGPAGRGRRDRRRAAAGAAGDEPAGRHRRAGGGGAGRPGGGGGLRGLADGDHRRQPGGARLPRAAGRGAAAAAGGGGAYPGEAGEGKAGVGNVSSPGPTSISVG